jgi:hypothetical protein
VHPIAKLLALLEGLVRDDLAALTPAQRMRFAALCRYWADAADPPKKQVGVLNDLRSHFRDE